MRKISLLVLLGLFSLTQINCGPKSSPSSPSGSTTSYNFLMNLGYAGSGAPPSFAYPTGIVAADGKIFVGDFYGLGMYIEVFDPNGSLITYFAPLDANGNLIATGGMKTDKHGHLYTTSIFSASINSYNLNAIPTNISGEGVTAAFTYNADCDPIDVAPDANGVLYVADGCGAIYSVYQQGTSIGSGIVTSEGDPNINGGLLDEAEGIAVNAAGTTIYTTDESNNVIEVYDSNLNWIKSIGDAAGAAGTETGKFSDPTGIIFDNDGNLLVSDSGNGRIQKFSASGNYLTSFGNTAGSASAGLLGEPYFLTMDPDNNVYVTDFGNYEVLKYGSN